MESVLLLINVTFLSAFQAVEELRGRLENLKTMFGSGIKALDGLAGELDSNAQSTFDRLNCEVSKHSSALGEVCIFSVVLRNYEDFFFLISFFLM